MKTYTLSINTEINTQVSTECTEGELLAILQRHNPAFTAPAVRAMVARCTADSPMILLDGDNGGVSGSLRLDELEIDPDTFSLSISNFNAGTDEIKRGLNSNDVTTEIYKLKIGWTDEERQDLALGLPVAVGDVEISLRWHGKMDILSPDEFTISMGEGFYQRDAEQVFKAWAARFEAQGYYSTVCEGSRLEIPVADLLRYCELEPMRGSHLPDPFQDPNQRTYTLRINGEIGRDDGVLTTGMPLDYALGWLQGVDVQLTDYELHRVRGGAPVKGVELSADWNMYTSQVNRIAHEFCRLLDRELGSEKMAEVVKRNATPAYYETGACATHDFCDANMTMAEALKMVTGIQEYDGSDDDTNTLWNYAWERAAAYEFQAPAENCEGMTVEYKPEWSDSGDHLFKKTVVEDRNDGLVIRADLGMALNPTAEVPFYMVASMVKS